jgi:hypothetical protein
VPRLASLATQIEDESEVQTLPTNTILNTSFK